MPPLLGTTWPPPVTLPLATQRIVTVAVADPDPALLEVNVAVLVTVPHDAVVVGLEICTVLVSPDTMVPKLHVIVPALIEH